MYKDIIIEGKSLNLEGHIVVPPSIKAWVVFVHGSGSSRKSKRNNWVASELNKVGYATLLFDLLTQEEDLDYDNRFNIPLLTDRILLATSWLIKSSYYGGEPIAYFGASTGAAAALSGAALLDREVPLYTVISRGGRPDLTNSRFLEKLTIPVLLIVGGNDDLVIKLNQKAEQEIENVKLKIIKGATHLFEEPGTLDRVVIYSINWLNEKLPYTGRDLTL